MSMKHSTVVLHYCSRLTWKPWCSFPGKDFCLPGLWKLKGSSKGIRTEASVGPTEVKKDGTPCSLPHLNCFHLQHFWQQICEVFSSCKPILQLSRHRASYTSVQSHHQFPRISIDWRLKGQSHKAAPNFRHQEQQASDQSVANQGPLINLLTEYRKTIYSLVYYEGYYSGSAKWKRYLGQGMEEVAQIFHVLSGHTTHTEPLCIHQPWNSPNPLI